MYLKIKFWLRGMGCRESMEIEWAAPRGRGPYAGRYDVTAT